MSEQQNAPQAEKVKLKVSQILADLNEGLDRDAIKAKYGLSHGDMHRLFQHEKLKGVRVKKAPSFELEDDTEAPVVPTKKEKGKAKAEKEAIAEQATVVEEQKVEEEKAEEEEEVTSPTEVTAVETPAAQVGEPVKEVEQQTEVKKDLW